MAEDKENLVTIKALHQDREWIKDEQARLRKLVGGEEPTHGEIIHILIEYYKIHSTGESPLKSKIENRNQIWHAMLDEVLADKDERIGIEKNLQWAVDSIRKKPKTKRAHGS